MGKVQTDGSFGPQGRPTPNQNEAPSMAERAPVRTERVSDGPKRGEAGEYKAARYPTRTRTVTLAGGRTVTVEPNIREDR